MGSAPTMLRKDHHRALSAWAQQLGPVYAIRILFWHVRPFSDWCLRKGAWLSEAAMQAGTSSGASMCRHRPWQAVHLYAHSGSSWGPPGVPAAIIELLDLTLLGWATTTHCSMNAIEGHNL